MGPEFGQGAGSRTRQNSIALPVLSCPARIATSLTPPFVHSLVKNTLLGRHRDMVALRGNAPRSFDYQSSAFLLSYRAVIWGDRRGTIPRHPVPQTGALPTELRPT